MEQLFLPHFGIIKNGYRGKEGLRDVFFQPSNRLKALQMDIVNDPEFQLAMRQSNARRARDCGLLANQVVGAEVLL